MRHRLAVILPVHLLAFFACYRLAFGLRYDFVLTTTALTLFRITLPYVLLAKLLACLAAGDFRRTYRHVAVVDLVHQALTACTVNAVLFGVNLLLPPGVAVPRSVVLIDLFLTLPVLATIRVSYRTGREAILHLVRGPCRQRTLIFGVREPSIGILRMLNSTATPEHPYRVVGFHDDRIPKQESLIAGLPVFSATASWDVLKSRTGARHLLIPGDVPGRSVRDLLHVCRSKDIKVHVIPSVSELVEGRFRLAARDVTVDDLLRREPNVLNMAAIKEYVTGHPVLVTGAAGSIGSELSRQILALQPSRLILLDQSEFGMFTLEREFAAAQACTTSIRYVIADVLDESTMDRTLREEQPSIIFHAAAYKHVPLMEDNPQAAVLNNVLGTKTVADLAVRHGVDRFVLISTDKAVRPTSVMGATKLIAEKYVQALSPTASTQFITVRFGNVLNSLGSVVPTFRRQIEAGGPITVTHPDMKRFFMTIPEAVQLVIQAGALGQSGDILILDMGEPVKIVDLAKDMIMLSGLRYPEDIEIVFTGIRPGEKLYEELFYAAEVDGRKVHEKIYCGDSDGGPPLPVINSDIRRLEAAAYEPTDSTLLALKDVVSLYADTAWVPSRLRAKAA